MDIMLVFILSGVLLIGSVLGLIAYSKVTKLEVRLRGVERKLIKIRSLQDRRINTDIQTDHEVPAPPVSSEILLESVREYASIEEDTSPVNHSSQDANRDISPPSRTKTVAWAALITQYWMVILGGVCLVFAGVFLVRYSIEHGMLGPTARTALGILFGVSLIAAGEKLRRSGRLEAGVHAAFVASGSLVIYSALLVSYHIYALISAQLTFSCLALMSAFSMYLALRHGPIMAGMGLLGAYLVPILVSTGSNNIEAALLYSFIVTCSSLWLQRYLYRNWIWWGTWVGALSWFILSLDLPNQAQGVRSLYLAALAYAGVALAFSGLKLRHLSIEEFPERSVINQITFIFAALMVAMIILFHVETLSEWSYPSLVLLPIIAALVARNNLPVLRLLPLIACAPILAELFSMDVSFHDWKIIIEPMRADLQVSYIAMLVFITSAFAVIGGRELLGDRHPGYWSSFILFMPLIAIVLAYLRISGMQGGVSWAVPTLMVGAVYAYLLRIWRTRKAVVEVEAALAIASQFAIAVACFFAFSDVTLTLVLAIQLIGLAYIDKKTRLAVLPLIIKAMLILVTIRLTFNPWIALYDVSSFTLLLTYAGCLFSCVVASQVVYERAELSVWLHSASAHVLILTLAVFTRYGLYAGDIFAKEFTLTESSIYICSWASIGIVYEWRSNHLAIYQRWYRGLAMVHIIAATALFVFYNMLRHNPLWHLEAIGTTPVFNLLLIGYGLPVVLAVIIYKRIGDLGRIAGLVGMTGLYMFATLEIRHLWNGGIRAGMPIKEGELYTYSLVWLLLSVAIMTYGAVRKNSEAQKAGVIALLVVIAKAFFWDMRDLDGLWRVVSFLGLGLSLLGVAFLFNKLKAVENS